MKEELGLVLGSRVRVGLSLLLLFDLRIGRW